MQFLMSPIEFPYSFLCHFYENFDGWIILLQLSIDESQDLFRYHRWLENGEHGAVRQDWQ